MYSTTLVNKFGPIPSYWEYSNASDHCYHPDYEEESTVVAMVLSRTYGLDVIFMSSTHPSFHSQMAGKCLRQTLVTVTCKPMLYVLLHGLRTT